MTNRHWLTLHFRRWRRQVKRRGGELLATFEQQSFARFSNLRLVWRRLALCLAAFTVLVAGLSIQLAHLHTLYQVYRPVAGGHFSEGIVGSFTTANPLFATSDVDTAVSRLLFAGLLTFDTQDHLVGALADSWQADSSGRVYTVHLRPNLTWHDGRPLTSDDVLFTYQTIQNAEVDSPLRPSWEHVVVTAPDHQTITFTLPNPLNSFPSSLTTGIVPAHILRAITPEALRSASFNTVHPVGAGPFRWNNLGFQGVGDNLEVQLSLVPFTHYYNGAPKLASFDIHTYATRNRLLQAYADQQVNAMSDVGALSSSASRGSTSYTLPLAAGAYVFFRTTQDVLSNLAVRHALVLAADRASVLRALPYSANAIDEPLLSSQIGYDPSLQQQTGDLLQARAVLDADGWTVGKNGIRIKNNQRLAFSLTINDTDEYRRTARVLQDEWRLLGADVQIITQGAADFQGVLSTHSYDAVLYGISLGADPDEFVYWDSSQNDPRSATRYNFSEYASAAADASLEAGRTRSDPRLRAVKYHAFLAAWQHDAPALALYQPKFTYLSHVPIYNLSPNGLLNTDTDRYTDVQTWMINRDWVTP